jgi:hypothetical protein
MRRLKWSLIVVPVLLMLPASSSAAPSGACHRAAVAPAAEVLAKSTAAVVFARNGAIYGCTYKQAKVRRLETCCDALKFRVVGVFAGYTASGSAIGDESTKLGVFNLKTGRLRAIRKLDPSSEGAGREIDTGAFVTVWRLTSAGELAWVQAVRHADGTLGPEQELRAAAGRRPWERVVDTGTIAKLSIDGRLRWTNQGISRSTHLDAGPFRRCDGLEGKPVLVTNAMRIVKVPARHVGGGVEFVGHDYFGCALPSGVVHRLGTGGTTYLYDNGKRVGVYGSDRVRFTNPVGTYVVRHRTGGSNSYTYEDGDVLDLVYGVGNPFMYYLDTGDGPEAATLPQVYPKGLALSATGVFAGVYGSTTGTGQHTVIGFSPLGRQHTLDAAPEADIAPASIAVSGAVVSWSNAGTPKSAAVTDG